MSGMLARARLRRRETVRPIDSAAVLSALPVPVVLLDPENRFRHVNQAGEQFFGMSLASLVQLRLEDLVPPDNPRFRGIAHVRRTEDTIADHELTLESPRLHKPGISVQCSALPEEPGCVLLVLQDASAARALDRQLAFRGAARPALHTVDGRADQRSDSAEP